MSGSGKSPMGVRCTVGVGPGSGSADGRSSLVEQAAAVSSAAATRATVLCMPSILLGVLQYCQLMRTLRPMVAAALAALTASALSAQPRGNTTLTAVPGIKVGHFTLTERPTGCTVVLAEAGATAAVDVRGAAPATRETDVLDPVNLVQIAHGIVLSGGSAFGLDSATGVMRYLEEKKIGFEFGQAHVPIVPAAALFDLPVGNGLIRPSADCGYKAAAAATTAP